MRRRLRDVRRRRLFRCARCWLIPTMCDALVGRRAHVSVCFPSFVTDPMAALGQQAEAELGRPYRRSGRLLLGICSCSVVHLCDRRARRGRSQCVSTLGRWMQDRPGPCLYLVLVRFYRSRRRRPEAHIGEALRLSPRDTSAYLWMAFAGIAKNNLGSYEHAVAWFRRAIEANRDCPLFPIFRVSRPLAQLGRLEGAFAVEAGLALRRSLFTVSRAWLSGSDDPTRGDARGARAPATSSCGWRSHLGRPADDLSVRSLPTGVGAIAGVRALALDRLPASQA